MKPEALDAFTTQTMRPSALEAATTRDQDEGTDQVDGSSADNEDVKPAPQIMSPDAHII
jgi:hypothetical protein